jgi:hypothetical protein
MPTQPYILLVDTAWDHRYIKRGDQVMLDALVSSGRGTIIALSYTDILSESGHPTRSRW